LSWVRVVMIVGGIRGWREWGIGVVENWGGDGEVVT
jgi:hypothetical protein